MDNQDQSQGLATSQQTSFIKNLLNLLSKNKYIVIAIAVLALISFGITSYFLVANKNKSASLRDKVQENIIPKDSSIKTQSQLQSQTENSKIPSTPTPTPTLTPTPTITPLTSPISTWSPFLSAKYGYSLKYPPDWTAKITTQQDPKILEYVVFNPKTATIAGTLSITLSYGTRTYAEALALDPQNGETIKIASVSAIKKNQLDSDGNKSITAIIPAATTSSIIINAKDKYKSIFDLMLTTLKLSK